MLKAGIVITLLALVETGLCLNCYHCTSTQNPACGQTFTYNKPPVACESPESISYNSEYLRGILPPNILTTVSGSPRYCHKFVTETGIVIRTCLDGNPDAMNKTCHVFDSNTPVPAKMSFCGVCDKDKCNGAGSISVSLPLATFTLIATYFLFKQ